MQSSRSLSTVAAHLLSALLGLALAAGAFAQPYPSRPVRVVVPFPPGGTTDILGRLTAQKLGETLGQQFVVENRGGAGGNVGAEAVAKSPADGYTLLVGTIGVMSINPHLYTKLAFDPLKDFDHVAMIALVPNALITNPSVPVNSVKDLVAYARANPGKLTYGSPGSGTSGHLSTELLKSMTGTDIVHVPYKGSGPALTDLMGGQISIMIDNQPSAIGHVRAGKLKMLGVTTEKRVALLPDVPTVGETVPGFSATAWFGYWAPAGTPRDVVAKLNTELNRIMATPDMQKRLTDLGAAPEPMSPVELAAFVKAESEKWAKVVKVSGAKID
jgi:tripartite-type tricarboxylate transporter receptor subunit TctC